MHHLYHTESLILERRPFGEANYYITLLTRDLGLIRASAQGIRLSQSKLKGSLTEFSFSRVSLVRGRAMWRITSAELKKNYYTIIRGTSTLCISARLFALVGRLVHGEEKNQELFDLLKDTLEFFSRDDRQPYDEMALELLVVLKILATLGYGTRLLKFSPLLTAPLSFELLPQISLEKKYALQEINTILRETHL